MFFRRIEKMKPATFWSVIVSVFLSVALNASEASPVSLPVNKWVKLPGKAEAGYIWSSPVYVPSRGQLLHWGGQEAGKGSRNDVPA